MRFIDLIRKKRDGDELAREEIGFVISAYTRGDVPDYALMMGVPAKRRGWMSRHGHRLPAPDADGVMRCPESGFRYQEVTPGVVRCLDKPEDESL